MNLVQPVATVTAIVCGHGCTFTKTIVHNFADLDDHRIFTQLKEPYTDKVRKEPPALSKAL